MTKDEYLSALEVELAPINAAAQVEPRHVVRELNGFNDPASAAPLPAEACTEFCV